MCLGAGGGGLAGRAVGSVGALQELGGAGADLVGEAVQLARAALSSLSARACSARRSAPTPTFSYSWDAARYASRRVGRAVRDFASSSSGRTSGTPAISARSARRARAVRRASSPARWRRAVLVGGAGEVEADAGAGLGLGGLVDQFTQTGLPAGAFAEPVASPASASAARRARWAASWRSSRTRAVSAAASSASARTVRASARTASALSAAVRAVAAASASSASMPGGQSARQEPMREARARSPERRAASVRMSSSRAAARLRSAWRSSSAACSSCMAGFGGTRKTPSPRPSGPAPGRARGRGGRRRCRRPRRSGAAGPRAGTSRARVWASGSVMTTPSTSSGRAARTAAWSAGSTAWAR